MAAKKGHDAKRSAAAKKAAATRKKNAAAKAAADEAAMIAAAVEQQGAATTEISRNVQEAAKGTVSVAENMSEMNSAAERTNAAADDTRNSSSQAAKLAQSLRSTIDTFLKDVAAA